MTGDQQAIGVVRLRPADATDRPFLHQPRPAVPGSGDRAHLLAALARQADAAGVPLTIHVERSNPAARLYQRLGLAPVAADDVDILMSREPAFRGHPRRTSAARR